MQLDNREGGVLPHMLLSSSRARPLEPWVLGTHEEVLLAACSSPRVKHMPKATVLPGCSRCATTIYSQLRASSHGSQCLPARSSRSRSSESEYPIYSDSVYEALGSTIQVLGCAF